MQFRTTLLAMFAAVAVAQNSTDTSESLPDLVEQLPQCAMSCFKKGASRINCAVTDFACLCGDKKQEFINDIGPCVAFSSGCKSEDLASMLPPSIPSISSLFSPSAPNTHIYTYMCTQFTVADVFDLTAAADVAPKICTAIGNNPPSAAVSSASAIVEDAAKETGAGNAAGRPEVGFGFLGLAALAAAAL